MFEQYPNEEEDKYAFPDSISIYDYLSTIEKDKNPSKNIIAIINVEGAIMTGETAYGVAGSDTIGTVAASIADVNRYANEYKIASSAPGSPSEGDMWSDTTNNVFKVHSKKWQVVIQEHFMMFF
jgi:hypothetical protein